MPTFQWRRGADQAKAQFAERVSSLDGWTYLEELWALHEAARSFPGHKPLTVVEIGSWKGRSTVALALGVRGRGAGRVFAIDPHTGSRDHIDAFGTVDTFSEFLANIQRAGVADLVEAIRSTSHEARVRFDANSVNVLFIDGSHEYDDVLRDIEDWAPALDDASVVAFNDPLLPGVYYALREVVLNKHSPYRNARYVANTIFFTFHRSTRWSSRDSAAATWLRILLAVRFRAQGMSNHIPGWSLKLGRRIYERLLH